MKTPLKNKPMVVGLWQRLLSDTLDSIFLGIVGAIILLFFSGAIEQLRNLGPLVGLVISFLYFGLLQSAMGKGQSLAKRLLKIQVIKLDGSFMSIPLSMLRFSVLAVIFYSNFIWSLWTRAFPSYSSDIFYFNVLSPAIVCIAVTTIFLVAFHPLKRGLHDLLAKTVVVHLDHFDEREITKIQSKGRASISSRRSG